VIQAQKAGEAEAALGVDDEDNLLALQNVSDSDAGQRSIRVTFEILDEASSAGLPASSHLLVEYVPKALSYSCMHLALQEINTPNWGTGANRSSLLARDIVLGRLPVSSAEDRANLAMWHLNPSQELAIRRALARPFSLIHGPPGTGKTRTAAVLMTLFAQRNLGSRSAILFSAPTNRAVDCALLYVSKLCEEHFTERLRARVEEDGHAECAICLEGMPDIITACGHVFHRSCISCALQQNGNCPLCRQVLKQPGGGLRLLRIYGADAEKLDFPVPRRVDHQGIQTFKTQAVPEGLRRFSLHWRCHAAVEGEEATPEAREARRAYDRLRSTSPKSREFSELRTAYYTALASARAAELRQTDIIFTTTISARRSALLEALCQKSAPKIRQVILDEAGQALEPEALCPLALAQGARHAVLFGDHRQLRPILRSRTAERGGLGISLFERLVTERQDSNESFTSLLNQQYRMHPTISSFPRSRFYGGRVVDDASVLQRPPGLVEHPSSGKASALLLWDSGDSEEEQLQRVRTVGAGGVGSRANLAEATRATNLAVALASVAGGASVAVLSWYNSQVAKVAEFLRHAGREDVHVGSIATAQGSEWNYVILSTVRSSSDGSLGLLSDPHTLNVALTRARYGLIVLGSRHALQRDPNWGALISDCDARGLIVQEAPAVRGQSR
jgi:superfamily I DNA and/or RNA helicase